MHDTISIFIALGGFILTVIVATSKITGSFKSSVLEIQEKLELDVKEIDKKFTEALAQHNRESDAKVSGIYRRMDEIQTFVESRYASKELMNIMHEGTAKNIGMLERKIDESRIELKGEMVELRKTLQGVILRINGKGGHGEE